MCTHMRVSLGQRVNEREKSLHRARKPTDQRLIPFPRARRYVHMEF